MTRRLKPAAPWARHWWNEKWPPAADGCFSGRLRGLHLPNNLSEKAGTPLVVFLPCAVWRVLKKNMLKHPRRVIREHLRWVAMELNKKARVNRLALSLKVLRHSLSAHG